MADHLYSIDLETVKNDLINGIIECKKRGLIQSAKWLCEMNNGLSNIRKPSVREIDPLSGVSDEDYDSYILAKTYFDTREYDRASYFTRNCKSPVPRFLHLYAMYMAKEKKRLDNLTDSTNLNDVGQLKDLSEILEILKSEHSQGKLDGYMLYLYGVVLKKLDLTQSAINVFVESIHATPTMWGSYVELAPLLADKDKVLSLNMPNHWIKHFFVAHAYLELFLNDDALNEYEKLSSVGFKNCVYIIAQIAIAHHNKRDVDKAIAAFEVLQDLDPFRLDNLDTFSNLLFVKELKTEMAFLAHKAVEIDKYRAETCCVIGNYFSIRCDHQKAISYFQRALKLNPRYLSAWTLMGHEFMELKNTNAAIQSYRKAIEVNKRDYRAWYGLGQSYEILKMHFYSLYYFKIAHQLRPHDSRMLVALGETYEKLEKHANAIKCYQKACNVGDIEGIALFKLGSLHEKLGDVEKAVNAYLAYCMDERATVDKTALYHAYIILANYYESKGNYDEAAHFAYKCLESEEKKSEAKSLLKSIENKRALTTPNTPLSVGEDIDCNEVWMDESDMIIENVTGDNSSHIETGQSRNDEDESQSNIGQGDMNSVNMSIG